MSKYETAQISTDYFEGKENAQGTDNAEEYVTLL